MRAGETVLVPYRVTHATYNLAPTLSLVRSGCGGMIPSLSKEVLNPTLCPGPHPPDGRADWDGSDFVVPPPPDAPAGARYPHLVRYADVGAVSGTRENRDYRVKVLVLGDESTAQGRAALARAEARAAALAGAGAGAGAGVLWAHVPCNAANRHCGVGLAADQFPRLMADGRAVGVGASAIDLGRGYDARRVDAFLASVRAPLRELSARLATL